MRKAEFPERTCRQPVMSSVLVYSCELPDVHPGPCASYSSKISLIARASWEAANPDWEKRIGSIDIMLPSPHGPKDD